MLQLHPQEEFVIARGLEDHSDSTAYYVRAVIRNAKTDQLIDTVDLDNRGDNHRYAKKWHVVPDPTGQGLWILITTSVYTDSGYNTKAENYGEKTDIYLVQDRLNAALLPTGGDVNYEKVRTIIQEELKSLPQPEPVQMPEMPNMPFFLQPVLNAIGGLRNDIQAIEMPVPDFSGVEYRLGTLEKAIKAIKIPETDLSPVLEGISALGKAIEPYTQKTTQDSEALLARVRAFFSRDVEAILGQIAQINKKLAQMPFLMLGQPKPADDTQEDSIDYSQLLNQ